ncbi:hypothetical protein D9M68_984840 [compost metagenome]
MVFHHSLAGASETSTVSATRFYTWVVFALSFGLLSGSSAALVFCFGTRHAQYNIQKRGPTVAGVRPVGGMS